MAKLYIVSTPIGNLQDITLRAIETLKNVDLIACEDTRKTGMLLTQLNIDKKQLTSYYEENEQQKIPEIIEFIKSGKTVALVSNAGTPAISDPGFKLIRECTNQNIQVESIPGPSAVIAALTSSGLSTDKFIFLGFLPEKQGHQTTLLNKCKEMPFSCTFICYVSPYKIIKNLQHVLETFGDIEVVICRELTKKFEEVKKDKISQLLIYLKQNLPRGEYVILWKHELLK